jgi:hypothetical protein
MSPRVVGSFRSAALLCVVALSACETGSLIIGTAGPGGSSASVAFVNATGNNLNLVQGGVVTNAIIAPGSTVACLVIADPETPSLSARLVGTTTDLTGFPATFASNGRYTVVAYLGPSATIQFISIPLTITPLPGFSGLRVFNGSAALSLVDVYATVPNAVLGTPNVSSLVFGGVSNSFNLSAGSTQVRLTNAGTTTVLFDAGTLVLEANKSYSLVVSSATPAILIPDC